MKILAIITARGGSKRIPKKNIKLFLGKPIISYPIDVLKKCGIFDEIMVSTDDQEIKEVAESLGVSVPFMRSAENSDDFSGTSDVILEVLNEYIKIGKHFDFACCIYPASPLIKPESIVRAFDHLIDGQFETVVPVVRFSFPIQRALHAENGKIKMIWPENITKRSQDLEPTFHDSGQFYWFRVENFLNHKQIWTDNSGMIELPETEVQDIDNLTDWEIAEFKYKYITDKSN